MENQFVPYELAVKLKELGFDLDVNAGFCGLYRSPRNRVVYGLELGSTIGEHTGNVIVCGAPLWQQAFDWFRERYGFICEPKKYVDWWFDIEIIVNGKAETECIDNTINFETYQEARTACLEKLIELITNK